MRYEARLVSFSGEDEENGWLWRKSAVLFLVFGGGGDSLFERVRIAGCLGVLLLIGCMVVTREGDGVFLVGYGPVARHLTYEIKKEAMLDAL